MGFSCDVLHDLDISRARRESTLRPVGFANDAWRRLSYRTERDGESRRREVASKQFWAMARPTSSPVDKTITNLTIFSSSTQAAVAGEACDGRSGFTPAIQAHVRLTCFGSSVPDCTQGLLPISVRPMAKNCTSCWQSSGVRRHASQESLHRLEKTLIDGLPSKTQRSTSHARQKPLNYERIHRRGRGSIKCHVFGDSVFLLPRSIDSRMACA